MSSDTSKGRQSSKVLFPVVSPQHLLWHEGACDWREHALTGLAGAHSRVVPHGKERCSLWLGLRAHTIPEAYGYA